MPQDLADDKSILVQVMAWCRQATSHYLSQCWPRYLSPYGVTGPQWDTAITNPCKNARLGIDIHFPLFLSFLLPTSILFLFLFSRYLFSCYFFPGQKYFFFFFFNLHPHCFSFSCYFFPVIFSLSKTVTFFPVTFFLLLSFPITVMIWTPKQLLAKFWN